MGTTILAVDDSASVRKMVQFTLESKGLQAKVAENGLEALEVLKHHIIDAIILDINMPKMNGLEFLQIVKSQGEYATIPVIMLTTEGQDEDKDKAIALGADAVYIATAALVAMGCTVCQKCYTGKCPWGIATSDPWISKRINPDIATERLVNLLRGWSLEIKDMMGGMGINAIESLRGNRLALRGVGLTDNELKVLGVKRAGE